MLAVMAMWEVEEEEVVVEVEVEEMPETFIRDWLLRDWHRDIRLHHRIHHLCRSPRIQNRNSRD